MGNAGSLGSILCSILLSGDSVEFDITPGVCTYTIKSGWVYKKKQKKKNNCANASQFIHPKEGNSGIYISAALQLGLTGQLLYYHIIKDNKTQKLIMH